MDYRHDLKLATLPAFPSPQRHDETGSLSTATNESETKTSDAPFPEVGLLVGNDFGIVAPSILPEGPLTGNEWSRDDTDLIPQVDLLAETKPPAASDDKSSDSAADETESDENAADDPDSLFDAMVTAGVPQQSMPDVFRAMKMWHCRCCTRLNKRDDVVCVGCHSAKGSLGLVEGPMMPMKRSTRTAIGYDYRMALHREMEQRNIFEQHPERPDRIIAIFAQLEIDGLVDRCIQFPTVLAQDKDLARCHTQQHCEYLDKVFAQPYHHINGDTYVCNDSKVAARLSAGIVIDLTEKVISGQARNAFAVVRPPGHHAETDQAMGFCMYNNVAVAARVARDKFNVQRVLIVDWDIHHGNGTEHMFENDPSVMYCSLHRFDRGEFYPGTGSSYCIGKDVGIGYNINIAWPHGGMGDAEYMAAFSHVLMPIFSSFNPELVLVSAGFDSALGDPLGGCKVTPGGYAYMTSMLSTLANGKLVLALEGGYNLQSIAKSASACVHTLLGDPIPPISVATPCEGALTTIAQTQRLLSPYWDSLKLHSSRSNYYVASDGKEQLFKPESTTEHHEQSSETEARSTSTSPARSIQSDSGLLGDCSSRSSSLSSQDEDVQSQSAHSSPVPPRRSVFRGRKHFLRWRWLPNKRRRIRRLRQQRRQPRSPISELVEQTDWAG